MLLLNKIPFANIDPCLRKYSKTLNTQHHNFGASNEKIFCCITINQEKVYLFSDFFLFQKDLIYPVNLYLYKLFMFVFKFRKRASKPLKSYERRITLDFEANQRR